jgi:phosphoribosylformylglycinamidine synthase
VNCAVIRFPGSNCDADALHVARDVVAGSRGRFVWHKEHELPPDVDAVIVPGGFTYGDYLRAGAMAARSNVMGAVKRFAERGGPVLGICNGFQILCEAGLLDGALARNASLRFECRDVFLRVEGKPTPFTARIPAGRILRVPIAHAEGRFLHPEVEALEAEGRVVFRYVDEAGAAAGEGQPANPNGSVRGIAGIANRRGNVVGLMPHPERAAEAVLGSADGRLVFDSLAAELAGSGARV